MKSLEKGCPDEHPLIFAPGMRGGCLPYAEARGGDLARNDLPHPRRDLILNCEIDKIINKTA